VSAVEHHAVLRAAEELGARVVPVDAAGIVDLAQLEAVLHPGVALVSVMLANNETGAIQPLVEIAALVRSVAPGAVLHTDAVAALGCLDPAVHAPDVDLLSLGAHKFGGPKGAGALVVRAGTPVVAQLVGGAQERGRRAGTHDVAGIVGMAAALEAAALHRAEEATRLAGLRDRLADGLLAAVDAVTEHGPARGAAPERRLPTIVNLGIDGVDDEELLLLLDEEGVAASAGAACASGAAEPSHVLLAMGLSRVQARSAVRFSLGHSTTPADVAHALAVVPKVVERLRR
jgi:cysteine desulfurase